jgi:hypothetical protein
MGDLAREIIHNGKIATLRKSTKEWRCAVCELPVMIQEPHYEVVYSGSGVKGKLDAEHVHGDCIWSKLNDNGNPFPPTVTDETSGTEVSSEKHLIWDMGYQAGRERRRS